MNSPGTATFELVFSLLEDNEAARRSEGGGMPTGGTDDDVDFLSVVLDICRSNRVSFFRVSILLNGSK